MRKETYKFDRFYAMAFDNALFDENKGTMFLNQEDLKHFSSQPKRGDNITIEYNDSHDHNRIWINDELVFELTDEFKAQQLKIHNEFIEAKKRQLGVKPF